MGCSGLAQATGQPILRFMMTSLPSYLSERVSLAPYTTLQLGGPARYFATCSTVEMLQGALEWADHMNHRVHILGGGSNVVFPDRGFEGLVLKMDLRGVQFDAQTARVGAGENWDHFVVQCIERGLAGVECLSGIPGQVGATPIQNVGAYGQEVCETVTSVRAIDRASRKEVEFTRAECDFSYRHSRFKGTDADCFIITEVRYALREDGCPHLRYTELEQAVKEQQAAGPEALNTVRSTVLSLRTSKSMVIAPNDPNSRSAGSFFINPVLSSEQFNRLQKKFKDVPSFPDSSGVKVPAAWLVERAGFAKGYRRDGVGVSQRHALALVNYDGSTDQLLKLAADIQNAVKAQFAIHLQREPVVVP